MQPKDRIVRATGARTPFRLVAIDITQAAREIGKQHGAKAYTLKLLAETTIASLFLSSSLKFPGTVSLRLKFSGDISLIQADTTPQGLLRAMIPQNEIAAMNQFEPALIPQQFEVFKLNESGKRVQQSVTETVKGSIGQNLASYLLHSEQVRSAVGIEAKFNAVDSSQLDYAIGFMIEAFPDLSEKDTAIIEQVVLTLPPMNLFFDSGVYHLDSLIDQLRGPYDIDIVKEIEPKAYCPCSRERMLSTLSTLPPKDLKELSEENKPLEIICDFCRNRYEIFPEDIEKILSEKNKRF